MKKLCISPIIYTILILIAITTFTCDTSKSKYIKEDGEAIKYSVYIKKMGGTPLNSLPNGKLGSSTYEEMKFFYSFNRSGNMLPTDTSETYEILPKNTCSITDITADNAIIFGNLVTFNNVGNETITVYLNCNVSENIIDNYVNVSMSVNNYFNNSLPKFLYTNGINNISLDDYYLAHPKPEITDIYSDDYKTFTMTENRENKLEALNTWLNLFANEYQVITYDNIYNYIDFLKTAEELTDENIELLNNYEGITAEIDNEGNYVFKLDDRFTSLVRTHSEKISKNLYFYEGEYDMDELFLYYISHYEIYPEGSAEYSLISEYITNNEEENETILDLANRLKLGMTYNSETHLLDGVEDLYGHVAYIVPMYKIEKNKILPFKYSGLQTHINNTTVLQGTDLITQILNTSNTKIKDLLSITTASTMFDSYVYLESEIDNKNAIVHIYSNDESYTYIDITFVDSNVLTYEYNVIDNDSIKSDLDYISTTFYNENLSLLDIDPEVVNNYNTLENGTYNLNIGTIIVTGNKIVTVTLGDRDVTQNDSNEEENIVIENEEEVIAECQNIDEENEEI